MITSFNWVLVALLIEPATGLAVDYAFLDYFHTRRECYEEIVTQPYFANVKYICMRRGST